MTPNISGCLKIIGSADTRIFSHPLSPRRSKALWTRLSSVFRGIADVLSIRPLSERVESERWAMYSICTNKINLTHWWKRGNANNKGMTSFPQLEYLQWLPTTLATLLVKWKFSFSLVVTRLNRSPKTVTSFAGLRFLYTAEKKGWWWAVNLQEDVYQLQKLWKPSKWTSKRWKLKQFLFSDDACLRIGFSSFLINAGILYCPESTRSNAGVWSGWSSCTLSTA